MHILKYRTHMSNTESDLDSTKCFALNYRKFPVVPEYSTFLVNCAGTEIFPKFPKKRTTSRGIPKLLKIILLEIFVLFDCRLNGSHFRNSTVFGCFGYFARKFLYSLPLLNLVECKASLVKHSCK